MTPQLFHLASEERKRHECGISCDVFRHQSDRTKLPGTMARNTFKQIAQFATVGGLDTITNLIVFFVLVDVMGFPPVGGAVIAFAIAVTQNYALNELWTFNAEGRNRIGAVVLRVAVRP